METETKETTTVKKFAIFPRKWSDKLNIWVAATTLLLAACATFASFKAAGYGNQVVLAQNQASDSWAFYQAKSIKETIYKQQIDAYKLQLAEAAPAKQAALTELINKHSEKIATYKEEEKAIAAEAKKLEEKRNFSQKINAEFGQSLIFLQVAILLASMSAIMKFVSYWYAGMGVGMIGVIIFVNTLLKTL